MHGVSSVNFVESIPTLNALSLATNKQSVSIGRINLGKMGTSKQDVYQRFIISTIFIERIFRIALLLR